MRSNEILEQELNKMGVPVKYYEYAGVEKTYIVYNEEAEQPVNHGDNRPRNSVIWWQVHIFTPKQNDFREYKRKAKKLLEDAGFCVTDIETLYEKETKTIHVAISCHIGEREE